VKEEFEDTKGVIKIRISTDNTMVKRKEKEAVIQVVSTNFDP
jgi:hypothetical protein